MTLPGSTPGGGFSHRDSWEQEPAELLAWGPERFGTGRGGPPGAQVRGWSGRTPLCPRGGRAETRTPSASWPPVSQRTAIRDVPKRPGRPAARASWSPVGPWPGRSGRPLADQGGKQALYGRGGHGGGRTLLSGLSACPGRPLGAGRAPDAPPRAGRGIPYPPRVQKWSPDSRNPRRWW